MNKIIWFLTENPGTKIFISGHTDDQGSDEYNMNLSEKRAKAVYNFLINHDINHDRLTYKGFGESKPISSKTDEKSRKLNRRIEFSIKIKDDNVQKVIDDYLENAPAAGETGSN